MMRRAAPSQDHRVLLPRAFRHRAGYELAAALGAAFLLGEGEGPDAEQSDRRALSQVHIAAAAGLQVACLRLACDRRDIDERESTRVPQ